MFKQRIKQFFGVFLFVVFSNTASAFSNSDLQEFLGEFDAAAEHRDVAKIADLLSDRVLIVVEMPSPQGEIRLELNKGQYLELLEQGWDAIGKDYTYTRESTQIESDGVVAQVVSVIREKFVVDGQAISSETLEIADVTVEKGKLVVVKVVGQVHVQGDSISTPSI